MIGVHHLTLHRWLKAGKVKPKGVKLANGSTIWQWTDADIEKAKKLKQPPGRPRKAR
jgi:predicted site-specific integrase-resolvase